MTKQYDTILIKMNFSNIILILILTCFYIFINKKKGKGWDYIQDKPKELIFAIAPTNSTTNDGVVQVADCVDALPLNDWVLEDVSVMTNALSFSPLQTHNFGAGTHTSYYRQVMHEQLVSKTFTTSARYTHKAHDLRMKPTCELHTTFKHKINTLFATIQMAPDHTAELLKEIHNDYGTHYVSESILGARLYEDTYLQLPLWFKYQNTTDKIKQSAATKLAITDSPISQTSAEYRAFLANTQKTVRGSLGGGQFNADTTVAQWKAAATTNPAVIHQVIRDISDLLDRPEFANESFTVRDFKRNTNVNDGSKNVTKFFYPSRYTAIKKNIILL